MKVKALCDHFNDYSVSGSTAATGESRLKKKGTEYEIPDDRDAKVLIDAGIVERAKDKS